MKYSLGYENFSFVIARAGWYHPLILRERKEPQSVENTAFFCYFTAAVWNLFQKSFFFAGKRLFHIEFIYEAFGGEK